MSEYQQLTGEQTERLCAVIQTVTPAETYDDLAPALHVALTRMGWTPPVSPPLTVEPTDLAARVEDVGGRLWALDPKRKVWVDLLDGDYYVDWSDLTHIHGPLRLWEPDQ